MRFVFALLALFAPFAAAAAPITYLHTGGSASVVLVLNGDVVASAVAPLDGMSLSFDAATATITDLDLLLVDSLTFPRLLGWDTLEFSMQAVPASGYASSGTGANPYSVTSGPLLVTFSGAIVDGLNGPPPPTLPFNGSLTTGMVPATVTLAGDELSAVFSSTKMMQYGWQSLELWVEVTFEGTAVPEPATWLTLASGLLGLAALGRRGSR
jgi:hypothetical protein